MYFSIIRKMSKNFFNIDYNILLKTELTIRSLSLMNSSIWNSVDFFQYNYPSSIYSNIYRHLDG
ncbi:hypothetical protein DERF_008957 [Dermatophagoides farinae]|uniref:Uncharacterized protein n=1 Tax=Dermatophagoides farinae TaxID=6954 RepID=A0A922HVG1_DERFA|nr:hypothetical protein DERF_008957 [Dermatophagoides farinae]